MAVDGSPVDASEVVGSEVTGPGERVRGVSAAKTRGGRRGRGIVAVGADVAWWCRVSSSCVSGAGGGGALCWGFWRLRTVWKRERMTPIWGGGDEGGFVLRGRGRGGWGMTQVGCVSWRRWRDAAIEGWGSRLMARDLMGGGIFFLLKFEI